MTSLQKKRAWTIGLVLLMIAAFVTLILTTLSNQLLFFVTPTELKKDGGGEKQVRLGGMVVAGSIHKEGVTIRFDVTDFENTVAVQYTGLLPDLFREGQGVVAEGTWQKEGFFLAKRLLAKHDENYMPPEVARSVGGRKKSNFTPK